MRFLSKQIERDLNKYLLKMNLKWRLIQAFLILLLLIVIAALTLIAILYQDNEIVHSSSIVLLINILAILAYYLFSFYAKKLTSPLKKNGNISQWIHNIHESDILSNYIGHLRTEKTDIQTLIVIKEKILHYCDNEIIKLRLLRSYYYTMLKNNKLALWQIIIGIIVVIVGYIMKGVLVDGEEIVILNASLDAFSIILLTTSLIIFIYSDVTSKRNEILLYYKILDELIEYLETEKK